MTGPATCMVLDCRRTGTPTASDRPFICAKHEAVAGQEALRKHRHSHGANRRNRGQDRHWRFLEQSSWERIRDAVAANFELKPNMAASSSCTKSGS